MQPIPAKSKHALHPSLDTDLDGVCDTGETKASFDYELRSDGKRVGLTEVFDNDISGGQVGAVDETNVYSWVYDAAGRLIANNQK